MSKMQGAIRPRARSFAWMLTLVYFASYLTRINFTVMLVVVCSEMQLTKLDLAAVVTGLTVAYGLGQIVSGMIGDRLKPKNLITFGLCLAAACNVVMSFLGNVPVMTAVWCVNGFAHSMLWPPMVRLMSARLDDREYGYTSVRVLWGSSIATILLYLGCPVLLGFMSWRGVLRLCAVGGLLIAAVWTAYANRHMLEPMAKAEVVKESGKAEGGRSALPGYVILPIILIMLGIIAQGALRDGVTNWMPSFMLETFGLPEEKAIVVTVVLAVISMVCSTAFNALHQRWLKNEVFCAAVIFMATIVCGGVLLLVSGGSVAMSALLMALIVACMHGVNLMLITIVPKRFAASGRVSTYSGLFNSCTYVGAALSTYGFAALADARGWQFTILMWVVVAVLGCAVCLAAVPVWKRFCGELK